MDNTLKQRTETLTATIGQGAVLFDNTLKQRTEALTATSAKAPCCSTTR